MKAPMPCSAIQSRPWTSNLEAVVGGAELARALGEVLGGREVRGAVLEVAGAVRRAGDDARALDRGGVGGHDLERRDLRPAVVGARLQLVEAVEREQRALD
jgi:hypothetical protein